MRCIHFALALLMSLGLVLQGCTLRGGRGGGNNDDDDSGVNDDDDTTSGDDDDTTSGDDDDTTGGGAEVVSNAGGSYTFQLDFSTAASNDLGWNDCQRVATLTQVSEAPNGGCPGCDFVMKLDSSAVTTNCNAETGVTNDPLTGIQFGVSLSDGDLRFWNYGDEAWDTFLEGGSASSSGYSGDSGWDADTFDPGSGTEYDYEFRTSVSLTWN